MSRPIHVRAGPYPVAPLTEGSHGGFDVEVRVHMWAASATSGTLTAMGEWGETASQVVQVPAGDSQVTLKTTASAAYTWLVGLNSTILHAWFPAPCSPLPYTRRVLCSASCTCLLDAELVVVIRWHAARLQAD